MELRQIRYFVAVAEERTLTAAAGRLHVSQPPITRQIQKLEAELDIQLFERTQRGVKLTPAGEVFLSEARKVLAGTQLAAERSIAAARGEIGSLEIGYFGSAIFSVVPEMIRAFRQENNGVSASLHQLSKKEQIDALKDGRIHVGISRYYGYEPGLTVETIAYEDIVVAIPADRACAHGKSISLHQLKREAMILYPRSGRPSFADEIIRIFRKAGIEPRIDIEVDNFSSALALTAAGIGVCPVPEAVSRLSWPNIRFLPISQVDTRTPINCIYMSKEQSPILKLFFKTLRSIASIE